MPMRRADYPPDWDTISAGIRTDRAEGKCEGCGVENHRIIKRTRHTYRYAYACETMRVRILTEVYRWDVWKALRYLGLTKVILTTAHLDRNPANNAEANLKALCQRCHLGYDMPQHVRNRAYGRDHDGEHQLTLF